VRQRSHATGDCAPYVSSMSRACATLARYSLAMLSQFGLWLYSPGGALAQMAASKSSLYWSTVAVKGSGRGLSPLEGLRSAAMEQSSFSGEELAPLSLGLKTKYVSPDFLSLSPGGFRPDRVFSFAKRAPSLAVATHSEVRLGHLHPLWRGSWTA
jgi:hypothetical protein